METAGRYVEDAGLNAIHKAMFASDSPGPIAGEIVAARLRFAHAAKRIALYRCDQFFDPLKNLSILAPPVIAIFGGALCPVDVNDAVLQSGPRSRFWPHAAAWRSLRCSAGALFPSMT